MSAHKYLFMIVILVHSESIFHFWKRWKTAANFLKILLPLFDD